jgi:hypothetical protein
MTGKNPLAELLRPHAIAIDRAAAMGDQKAKQIVALYNMHVSCPREPAAPVLCAAAFEDWRKTQP